MSQTYPKRLIEVDLPIARISAHARREKSIRHGHISTLHIWWARRPLAACRAVICAALWPDSGDPLCPPEFRAAAIRALQGFAARVHPAKITAESRQLQETVSEQSRGRWEALAAGTLTFDPAVEADGFMLRECLLDFIADFANWDNSTVPAYLETARRLTGVAHQSLSDPHYALPPWPPAAGDGLNEWLSTLDSQLSTLPRPLVVDPFAGGGSIPLEALRVGADAFASDLNPVAVLLNKVVLEYIPKYGNAEITMQDADGKEITFHGLAEAVRYWGNWVKVEAEKELAEFYPKDPDGSTPIAYLWARTILSEAPGQGDIPVEVPLIRSLWLCKKPKRKVALRWVRDQSGTVQTETVDVTYADGVTRKVRRPMLEIFEPEDEREVESGVVARGKATCPVTGYTTPAASLKKQMKLRRGGAKDARLFCVVTARPNVRGVKYRLPIDADLIAVANSTSSVESRARTSGNHIGPVEPTPPGGGRGAGRAFSQRNYGMDRFCDLFADRQLNGLTAIASHVERASRAFRGNSLDAEVQNALHTCLVLPLDKLADFSNALTRWGSDDQGVTALFSRQAISIAWDFAEPCLIDDESWGWLWALGWTIEVCEHVASSQLLPGTAAQADAATSPVPSDAADAFVTDPPYYDAVPYSDLSDFFYVWLKRNLPRVLQDAFSAELAPKDEECIVDDAKSKDRCYFESKMRTAMAEGRRALRPDGVGVVVFANKTTSGWESQLAAMVDSGLTITGSWPIDTESPNRLRARDSAALASSVHLVCRPREDADGQVTESVGEWRDVLSALPQRIHEWMPRLASEGVVGADAIFACLGPALEIFSRYSRVENTEGNTVPLGDRFDEHGELVQRGYLSFVWEAVSTEALALIFKDADASGLEPDARLTAMWLWTLGGGGTSYNGKKGVTAEDAESAEDEGDGGDDDEAASPRPSASSAVKGFTLEFDAARKIAQGLGVHLEQCESLVEVKGDKARLLPVSERTQYLFKQSAVSSQPSARKGRKKVQKDLFGELAAAESEESGWTELKGPPPGSTVLDRVHQAMILFAANRGELLKRFLVEDGVGKDARFWKLADNLNKLYPPGTEERRWVEGVLARKKGLGL